MTHARQQVREAAATLLKTSPTTWGTVFETRIPSTRAVMPYLLIFSDGEASENSTAESPSVYLRRINLVVVGRLKLPGNSDRETVEDQMDALAAEVETKLTFAALETALNHLLSLSLISTEMVVVIDQEDQPQYAEVTLNFLAECATQEGTPGTLL